MTEHPFHRRQEHFPADFQAAGFTMVEIAVVLVVIGIILAGAGAAWYTALECRRAAQTRAELENAKRCLISRLHFDVQYPTFTPNLDCIANVDPFTADVDVCLCEAQDAYGRPLYFLGGLDNATQSLAGQFVLGSQTMNRVGAAPATGDIAVTDTQGYRIGGVAFVLVSYGRDGMGDDPRHALFTPNLRAALLGQFTGVANATFQFVAGNDDIVVIVTSAELAAALQP